MSTTEVKGIQRDDTVHDETYFTAADMATAEVRGFRDGQAAQAAAGQDPVVAEESRLTGDAKLAHEKEIARLREALQFYADRHHFMLSDDSAWDTVSDEPQNLWCDESGTATVEDGHFARAALANEVIAANQRASDFRDAALAAQQPAPSAAPAEQQMVAYLDIGAGGYIDLGSELTDEALLRLPKGRHALVIAGTFGIDGYVAAKPSPTPQADSQPAPLREGEWINDAGRIKWLMWRVQDLEAKLAARAPADSVTASAGEVDDDVDAIALARYKVVPAHESMFHRFAVVAGGGKQQLYLGREVECENMARKFAGAFLDGAFYQSNIAPAQTADSVLEDAARYLFLRDGKWRDTDLEPVILLQLNSLWDAKIDAARKQGANHD